MVARLRVAVASDWVRLYRGDFWGKILPEDRFELVRVRIADDIFGLGNAVASAPAPDPDADPDLAVETRPDGDAGGPDSTPLAKRKTLFADGIDVLIVNWDALNGDPDYGSDIVNRWFAAHRRQMWEWIGRGGILIIEGQAVHDVPEQSAYDALLGPGELRVSGAQDELDPKRQKDRCGRTGRTKKAVRQRGAFCAGVKHLGGGTAREFSVMFPHRIADPLLDRRTWDLLYRGWFLKPRRRGAKLRWIVVAETFAKRRSRRHPICVVAPHGDGAIFATTMFLASSEQTQFVDACIGVRGRTRDIPKAQEVVRSALHNLASAVVSGAVVYGATTLVGANAGVRYAAATMGALLGFLVVTVGIPSYTRLVREWRKRRR